MRNTTRLLRSLAAAGGLLMMTGLAPAADSTLLFVGTWPKNVAVLEEASGTIIDRIQLISDAPRTLLPTQDRKKIIAITIKDAGFETIDVETRKVVDSFTLGSTTKRIRLQGSALDPGGRYVYVVMNVANKLIDRFEIEKPKFAIVDLQEKKIAKTVELPKEVSPSANMGGGGGGGRGGGQMRFSPDGKYLWFFRDNIYIVDTTDFKIVETIPLARPEFPYMEAISLSGNEDPNEEPGKMTAIFNTSDPVVHRRIFGVAQIDLNTRKIEFTPIGPAIASMNGNVRLSPDRKSAYGVTINGVHGDRYCEFFVLDMGSRKITKRASFPGRTRFSIGMTTDGKNLIVYGAGYTMELYDTTTLQFVRQIDMNADMTTPLVALPKRPVQAAATR
ncbi:MAG: hypothetical protein H7039_15555 [Bryobacteraceae bacterium]|nr:hypothetical protein [Bryobacteraceae bacterium]